MTDTPLEKTLVGQDIRGYRFDALVAQGGFGVVYRAFQPVVGRHVAIKVIHPTYASQENFVRRFDIEAQLIAQLEHPHIVPLFDYWRDPTGAYLVMRLLRGSLTDLLDQIGGPLPLDMSARMLDQIAGALATAHRAGVIHRDLKPANVLIDDDENAYLTDFGIAKRLFEADESEFERFGSPAYVAPEQVSGEVVSAQTDIYSLGIILFEMLTGTLPFNAPSQTLLLQQHLTNAVPSVTALRGDLPEEANYVIRRATQRQPKDRYADALMMAQDFRRLVQVQTGSVSSAPPAQRPRANRSYPAEGAADVHTKILNVAAVAQKNPYKGLRAFQEADAVDFYGREALINRLITRMRSTGASARLLALVGPSGSGKSSLARAGLIPALRRGAAVGSAKWFYANMTPGAQPMIEFEQSIGRIAVQPPDNLAAAVQHQPERVNVLLDKLLPPGAQFCLLIDQFEELFSLCKDDNERAAFLNMLIALSRNPRAHTILTLRADFYDRPLLHPAFGDLLRDCTEVVLPLTPAEMEAAIVRPAERLGVSFESGLTAHIIQDVSAQPGALPLLQYVLYELFEHRTSDVLTQHAYEAEGGVIGALARRAEAVYGDLDAEAQRLAQVLFLRLIVAGEGAEDTRRRITQSELSGVASERAPVEQVLEAYGRHRLLTFDRDSVTREPTVEIAHEALIRNWVRLRDWIDSNRTLLQVRQQLSASAADWEANHRDGGFLARGGRLISFETLAANPALKLSDEERDYLDASIRERQRDVRNAQRRLVLLSLIAIAALIGAAAALIARNEAQIERDRADNQARRARADELAVTAFTNLESLDRSLLLSMEALNSAQTFEARNSLLLGLQYSPHLRQFLQGANGGLRAVDTSPDGRYVAAAGLDGAVYVWDLQAAGAPAVMTGHEGAVFGLAFNADGTRLVTGGEDGTVRLWDVAALAATGRVMRGHDGSVRDVAFSPDGSLIASAGDDATIRLWDVQTARALGDPLGGHGDIVFTLAFSPDGKRLVSGSADLTLRLWNVETRQAEGDPVFSHRNWVYNVVFSPDGRQIASTGADGRIFLWDSVDVDARPFELASLGVQARALAYSRDGSFLAAGSMDNLVRVWDLASSTPVDEGFPGHTDDVRGVAFTTFGRMVSVGSDGKVLVWNTTQRTVVGRTLETGQPLLTLGASGDGTLIAAGGLIRSGRILGGVWNAGDGSQRAVLTGDAQQIVALAFPQTGASFAAVDDLGELRLFDASGRVLRDQTLDDLPYVLKAVAFSTDGRYVAAAGDAPVVHVYDLTTGDRKPLALGTGDEPVYALAFTPDGTQLASGDDAGHIHFWEVASGAELGEPIIIGSEDVTALAFNPQGTLLAVGTNLGDVRFFDAATRQPAAGLLLGHDNQVSQLVFDSTGSQLASASYDGSVRLWDVRTRRSLSLRGHQNWAMGVAFAPDGSGLMSGGRDGRIILWDLRLDAWRARACALANRNLTAEEWARYFPDVEYRATCGDA